MIGTGVFTSSGFLLADLGSRGRVLAAWAVGGLVAALGATSYGALARRIPESGGEYLFLSRTVHPAAGYLAGWVSLIAGFAAPLAAAALGFAEYARPWLPAADPRVVAAVLLLAAAALHASSVVRAARTQTAAVVVEVVLIAAFVAIGAWRLAPGAAAGWSAPPLEPGKFAVSLVWVSFSYAGWNTAVYVGGEVKDPTRNLPRAMLLGSLLVTGLYLAVNAVILWSVPEPALAGKLDVARIAAAAIGGPGLAAAVSALIALAIAAFVSAMTMVGPRICARMAADGYLPRVLAVPPGRPPRVAMAAQLVVALALVATSAYQALLTTIGFSLGVSTAATVVGLIRVRRREGAAAVPVWGWPWVPVAFLVFVVGSTAFTVVDRPGESALGLAIVLAGLAAFRLQNRRRLDGRGGQGQA